MTYEEAVDNYSKSNQVDGISFVLSEEDDLVGIDLDNCINDGNIEDWANDWVQERVKDIYKRKNFQQQKQRKHRGLWIQQTINANR